MIDYCDIADADCCNPPGYQVGGLGGMQSANPEPPRTRVTCLICGQTCCARCGQVRTIIFLHGRQRGRVCGPCWDRTERAKLWRLS